MFEKPPKSPKKGAATSRTVCLHQRSACRDPNSYVHDLPTAQALYLSFTNATSLGLNNKFVGLDNYIYMFHDKSFIQALINTAKLMAVVPVITIFCSLVLAFVLNQCKLKEMVLYRTLFYFPNIVSLTVVGIIWSFVFHRMWASSIRFSVLSGWRACSVPGWATARLRFGASRSRCCGSCRLLHGHAHRGYGRHFAGNLRVRNAGRCQRMAQAHQYYDASDERLLSASPLFWHFPAPST